MTEGKAGKRQENDRKRAGKRQEKDRREETNQGK